MKQDRKKPVLSKKIEPKGIQPGMTAAELIDHCFTSFNARGLRNACQAYSQRILRENTTVGVSLAGALVPAGLGSPADSSDQGRLHRLDDRYRCQSLP